MNKLQDLLKLPYILLDGGVGSELYKRGIYINRSFEEINLSNESLVCQIHEDYISAGSDIITTNTWGANHLKLKEFGLETRIEEINSKAVRNAKKAAKDKAFVAGSIGPLGVRIEPFGPTSFSEARNYFAQQVRYLKNAGCDCLTLETFSDLSEIKQAILACKEEAPELFLFAYLAIQNKKVTLLGTPLAWACKKLESWGVDVIGLNCNVGPKVMFDAAKELVATIKKPLSLKPNAGFQKLVSGRHLDLCSPEYMAQFAKDFFQLGAKFVGGCCGAGPSHIKMMSNSLRFSKAYSHEKMIFSENNRANLIDQKTTPKPQNPNLKRSRWAEKINNKEKVVCVELLPPESTDPSNLLLKTRRLKEENVDAINIPDGPRASARMSALLTSVLIERETKIETILHYTCRDRNILGIQSDFIGAEAIGLKNMLLVTGDPPKTGLYPHATGVFDVDAIGLTNIVSRLNEGIDIGGKTLKAPTSFSIGVGVNPGAPDLEHELKRFMWKVKAGAQWAITQPVFDIDAFKNFMTEIERREIKIPIIAGVWPLVSHKNALFLDNEVPGITIPKEIMKAMEDTEGKSEPAKVGVKIAYEMMQEVKNSVAGFQLSAPFGKVDLILPLITI